MYIHGAHNQMQAIRSCSLQSQCFNSEPKVNAAQWSTASAKRVLNALSRRRITRSTHHGRAYGVLLKRLCSAEVVRSCRARSEIRFLLYIVPQSLNRDRRGDSFSLSRVRTRTHDDGDAAQPSSSCSHHRAYCTLRTAPCACALQSRRAQCVTVTV
jgi:hypothetical protein